MGGLFKGGVNYFDVAKLTSGSFFFPHAHWGCE